MKKQLKKSLQAHLVSIMVNLLAENGEMRVKELFGVMRDEFGIDCYNSNSVHSRAIYHQLKDLPYVSHRNDNGKAYFKLSN